MGPRAAAITKEGDYIMESEIEAVVMRKFGDEQSNLLDKFERLAFEIQLNRAIQLGRSLSEPGAMVGAPMLLPPPDTVDFLAEPPPLALSQVRQGRRRGRPTGLKKLLKKLLKPVVGRSSSNNKGGKKEVPDPRDPMFRKSFSRSLRF